MDDRQRSGVLGWKVGILRLVTKAVGLHIIKPHSFRAARAGLGEHQHRRGHTGVGLEHAGGHGDDRPELKYLKLRDLSMMENKLGLTSSAKLAREEEQIGKKKAVDRSPIRDIEIKHLLRNALTTEIDSREVYMKGIDQSYYYEGYTTFKAEEL